jgi:hypothetical protein
VVQNYKLARSLKIFCKTTLAVNVAEEKPTISWE